MGSVVPLARLLAAAYLRSRRRGDEARTIKQGGGDDFPEVELALLAVRSSQETIERLERALQTYADPQFWGDGECYSSLAFHDQGNFARAALAGRDLLHYTAG
jgi:hypothetical protein